MSPSPFIAADARDKHPCSPGTPNLLQVQSFTERQLEELLHVIQRRLGTSQEQPGDFDYARMVAHELNNAITVSRLRQGLELGSSPA